MVLHEYYFDNLKTAAVQVIPFALPRFAGGRAELRSYDIWKANLGIGKMRGVAGRFATRIRQTANSQITGLHCTKRATSLVSIQCW